MPFFEASYGLVYDILPAGRFLVTRAFTRESAGYLIPGTFPILRRLLNDIGNPSQHLAVDFLDKDPNQASVCRASCRRCNVAKSGCRRKN